MAGTVKDRPIKPSKVVKPKRITRHTTTTTKNHRFQPFSERIAKLKIDPIRRKRNAEEREELSEETATYFGRSLEEWRDLNLSNTFTAFAREAGPYCDSLPVVLHNEGKIMDLLVVYIENADALAMEPLLNLMSQFAHDLDTRFERHFERAVATITSVAARHEDPAVVEWSFTCLAWLYKYLSRLLVPDLRPLYNLMSPYMGKEVQKPFIIRFAAESLSFLTRKAAAAYERNNEPLDIIVDCMLKDCLEFQESCRSDLYRQGVMTLLTETIKGVQSGVHSGGVATMRALLKASYKRLDQNFRTMTDIVVGVLTSLIHHTTAESFQPPLHTVLDFIQNLKDTNTRSLGFAGDLVFTVASVRKGTRIIDWKPVVHSIKTMINKPAHFHQLDGNFASSLLSALAVVLQTASVDAALSALDVLPTIRTGIWTPDFLRFCDLFSRLGKERFQSFILPQLQKFVLEQWEGHGEDLYLLLPHFAAHGGDLKLSCPLEMQDVLVKRLQRLSEIKMFESGSEAESVASANALLKALPYLKLGEQQRQKIYASILEVVEAAIEAINQPSLTHRSFVTFALGPCLKHLLGEISNLTRLSALWPKLCATSQYYNMYPSCWTNLLHYIKACRPVDVGNGENIERLLKTVLQSLSMPSHSIRQSSLEILQKLYDMQRRPSPDALATATAIESTPINLESSRAISMNIRRLVPGYEAAVSDPMMQKAIPLYCFGLLHLQLAQAWEDAVNTLAEICRTREGEETIIAIVQTWLVGTSEPAENDKSPAALNVDSDGFQIASDFECLNLAKLSGIRKQVFEEPWGGYLSPAQQFDHDHKAVPSITPLARCQALKVLHKVPQVAEKRSRILVPILLRWAGNVEYADEKETTPGQRWARKDQKAMLSVFAQFTNPKMLYKSSDVYAALLNLCANGDIEIQRYALKTIFAWKERAINQYGEHLMNLLDEARIREEISVFLQGTTEDETIHTEDQSKLMPVLLRLLYGRAIAGGKHGQGSRRRAIFVALSRFGPGVIGMFVDIAIFPAWESRDAESVDLEDGTRPHHIPLRQQLGMLNMLNDLLETLGPDLEPFALKIMRTTLLFTIAASQRLENATNNERLEDATLLRSVRQTGFQCLVHLFNIMEDLVFPDEAALVVRRLVRPRLEKFAAENTQSLSGMLRLFATWAASPKTAQYLSDGDMPILPRIAQLLSDPNAKDEVRLFILRDVIDKILQENVPQDVLDSFISDILQSIGSVLDNQPSKEVLDACVKIFSQLAGRITDENEAAEVLKICTRLLTQPNKFVSPMTKTGLLKTILPLLNRVSISSDFTLFEAVSSLFSRLSQPDCRVLLSHVLLEFCKADAGLGEIGDICSDLNAQMGTRLDEPDHERRERGFTSTYDKWRDFSIQQWLPIVHNCLFYVRDADDLVNRSSARQALERFIDAAQSDQEAYRPLISRTLLQGIERGMQEPSELVRVEYLRLLGRLVEKLPDWQAISDMTGLTLGGDEEASVFTNILHIQHHRRLRALRRLADEASHIGSANVLKIWLPLLEHFVFDQAEGDAGRTLADQTVLTIGALATSLNWSAFRATFKRYIHYISSKEDIEKTVLRLLGALVDALASSVKPAGGIEAQRSEIIARDFLPPLMEYLHRKDESTVDRRMPVAVTNVKLLLLLPVEQIDTRLAAMLTDVCHVLRSRSQEARDQTRKTLTSILSLLGPSYLGFILKELRSALQRGYQLHVLSFTVHSLLVNAAEVCQPDDLDHCLPDLVSVIMDDIFGITGQEKDAEEYKSSMKEVKSSKSFDTMELLARVTSVKRLGVLIQPLRSLLAEKLDLKMIKKAEDLLTRVRKGIDQNIAADSRDMLIFCHELVCEVYAEQNTPALDAVPQDYKVRKYLIQMEASNKSKSKAATTTQVYKLVSFALNLTRRVVRKHDDLQTPANMAGFLPMIGDALVQGQEDVKIAAIKFLATIIRLPMAELDANTPVYIKEAVGVIKAAPNMTSDSSKASLELITAVIREKRSVVIREADIAQVLKCLKVDIDEPDRQGIVYKFLRAVLGRKIVVTEVYELMDEVGKVMVTNPDRNVRESARSAYVQFVLDYPQGKDRWNKQTAFLVENLRYRYPSGRQSVMETLHQLLPKLPDDIFAQLASVLFVALVPVQVSDADQACREMAGILIIKLFQQAESEQLKSFLTLMDKWIDNHQKPMIQVASLMCWSKYIRSKDVSEKQSERLLLKIAELLTSESIAVGPQLLQAMLDTFFIVVEVTPDAAFAECSSPIWDRMQQCLNAPSVGLQDAASKLIQVWLSHLASSSSKTEDGIGALPLRGSGGLQFDADGMRQLCRTSLRTLMTFSSESPESLVGQTVRNLVFLGRCFARNGIPWQEDEGSSAGEDEIEEEDDEKATKRGSPVLTYLLNRLSYIIRQESLSTVARTAALRCQAELVNQLLELPNLQSLLRPLYLLTDPSIPQPQTQAHRNLTDKARELLDLIQKRVGPESYVAALGEARNEIKAKREERRQKRKIDAVSAPERWTKEKKKKHELQKMKKKQKSSEARARRRGW